MRATSLPALLAAALAVGSCGGHRAPNIILITVDTLRADRLGVSGHEAAHTPTIDGLAAAGVRFTQATTPFPRTTPALASLLTGLWPHHHGSREIWEPFETGTTLAQALAARGYATLAVSANPAAGRRQNLDRGFEVFVDADELPAETADRVTDAVLERLDRVDRDRPLFLWVHYTDPHFPYLPPPDYAAPQAPRCRELMDALRSRRLAMGHVEADLSGLSSQAQGDCSDLYDAEIAYTDLQMGRLVAALKVGGHLEGAYVVFTSDHGENLGEDDLWYGHGPSVHDAALRVPLAISGPGIAPGVDTGAFRLEDLAPTLLGLLGVPLPAADGVDLSARLAGGATDEPVALAEGGSALNVTYFKRVYSGRAHSQSCINGGRFSLCAYPGRAPHLYDTEADPQLQTDVSDRYPAEVQRLLAASRQWRPEGARERSVRVPPFKLIERPLLEGGYRRALYDLRTDRDEAQDVSAEHPDVAARLSRLLDDWAPPPPAPPAPMPSQSAKSLRALGYID